MITAQNLVRKYGDFLAVDDVSFEINEGQIVGLLGHNGAGKTTIMKMLTGYLEPSAGTAHIDGINIWNNRIECQKKIGYLPEHCPIYSEMTVLEYLHFVAEMRGIAVQEVSDAVKGAILKTELSDKATDFISTLSKGYRQRVGIAQAIIHNPQILILDEPTSGLDPSQIQEIRSLIRELSKSSTIILSTHILQEVDAVCDRVIIIRNGALALDSLLSELRHSNSLILSLNKNASEAEKRLQQVNGVGRIELIESRGEETTYRLEVKEHNRPITPLVARAVVDSGFELYSIHPERRDLETIFREINSGTEGARDAK